MSDELYAPTVLPSVEGPTVPTDGQDGPTTSPDVVSVPTGNQSPAVTAFRKENIFYVAYLQSTLNNME
jgi:hypothetical protein